MFLIDFALAGGMFVLGHVLTTFLTKKEGENKKEKLFLFTLLLIIATIIITIEANPFLLSLAYGIFYKLVVSKVGVNKEKTVKA